MNWVVEKTGQIFLSLILHLSRGYSNTNLCQSAYTLSLRNLCQHRRCILCLVRLCHKSCEPVVHSSILRKTELQSRGKHLLPLVWRMRWLSCSNCTSQFVFESSSAVQEGAWVLSSYLWSIQSIHISWPL